MRQMDEQSSEEHDVWAYCAKLEKENHDLKRQLSNRNNKYRALKSAYRSLNEKYRELTEHRKPRFRNKGKKRV